MKLYATKISLNEVNHNKELGTIKHIAEANGFSSNLVDRLIKKKLKNNSQPKETGNNNKQDKKYVCIEYNHSLEHTLRKELKNHGIELVFRTTNRTKNILKPKDKFDKN